MADCYECCKSPNLLKHSDDSLICMNCGVLIEYEDADGQYNPNAYRQSGSIQLTCNNIKKTKYSNLKQNKHVE